MNGIENPMLEAALGYARRGWSVIAVHSIRDGRCSCGKADCSSPGKHPIGKWKHRQTTRATEGEIVEQWERTPRANVGLVTGAVSDLIVLDIDDPNNPAAATLLASLSGAPMPVAVTGRNGGGLHLYFSYAGRKLANFTNPAVGMDGRGDGGYVVAPPSLHASGQSYRWHSDSHGAAAALSEAPEAVLRLFGGGSAPSLLTETGDGFTAYGRQAFDDELTDVRSTPEGGRNDRLNRAAFSIGQLVQSDDVPLLIAERELVAAGVAAGLPVDDVERTVRSGLEGGARNPRSLGASDRAKAAAAVKDNRHALPVEFFGEIEAALTNNWLVRDLIPQNALVLIYGAPGSGKSFLIADIALRIAADMDVDGRAVQPCPTVYVAAEGQTGFRKRVKAFQKKHAAPNNVPFALVPSSVDLFDAKSDLPRLFDAIDDAAARFDQQPGLIVVDTLAATFGSGDENTKDMVGYVNNLAKLRDRYSATVAVVHHRPKDHTNNTPRGHGSLAGAMDTILLVEASKLKIATVTKQKDAEAELPITFDLETVMLGHDDDGEPVTSAVVTYFRTQAGGKPLAKQAQAILTLLTDLLDTDDAEADPTGMKWVAEAAWRQAWIAGGAVNKAETRRKAFDRAKTDLRRCGAITLLAGKIALAPDAAATCTAAAGAIMNFAVGARPYEMSHPD
jgi:KaiC/GvpD/RAD55 family RecA-like ATPase